MSRPQPKVCLITTSPLIVRFFLVPLLAGLSRRFDVTLLANDDCSKLLGGPAPSVRMRVFPIKRKIAPLSDLAALVQVTAFLYRERYDAVVTVAPKAGLIGMLAAVLAHVRFRCHVFQGEVWATRRNPTRAILKLSDRIVARLASMALVVGKPEREVLIREKIVHPERSLVLGYGSISGVDTKKFAPNRERRDRLRQCLGISDCAVLVLFLGRLTVDKGVLDLAAACRDLAAIHPTLHLAIVGPDEDGLGEKVPAIAGAALGSRLHMSGLSIEPEAWIAAADIVSLPSYREGLANVILEAAACQVPVVASRIYGIVDALVENETGLAHPPGDQAALSQCLDQLISDPALREQLGKAGRAFVMSRFEQGDAVGRFVAYISSQIENCGVPR